MYAGDRSGVLDSIAARSVRSSQVSRCVPWPAEVVRETRVMILESWLIIVTIEDPESGIKVGPGVVSCLFPCLGLEPVLSCSA